MPRRTTVVGSRYHFPVSSHCPQRQRQLASAVGVVVRIVISMNSRIMIGLGDSDEGAKTSTHSRANRLANTVAAKTPKITR